jgi:hypothetical protein
MWSSIMYQRAVPNTGEVSPEYVATEAQAAEGLTKPLGPSPSTKFCNLSGIDTEELMENMKPWWYSFHYPPFRDFEYNSFTEAWPTWMYSVPSLQQGNP